MRIIGVILACLLMLPTVATAADFSVAFADPAWDGKTIPEGQQCSEYGGKGATPALTVTGIPKTANSIIIEFNDENYAPLSQDGGHGIVGYEIAEGSDSATLKPIPGDTVDLPEGMWIEIDNRDDIGVVGYLPPCSGGQGNLYSAKVFAVQYGHDDFKILAETYIQLGRY